MSKDEPPGEEEGEGARPPSLPDGQAPRRRRVVFAEDRHDPRATPERVRTARRRTAQSARWIERQINDPYVRRAKADGLRARSAYKLIELNERFGFLKPGARVVDLGAAPGGWAQVARLEGARAVVGVDLLPIEPMEGVTFFEGDFLDPAMPDRLLEALGGPPDVVLSDMAANTVGHRRTDHLRTVALAEAAAQFALDHLAPGGAFVTKLFQGGQEGEMLRSLKRGFAQVRHAKPPSSRAESVELFLVATGRKRD
jgi:23S rRNA (uridine2552-2'-O)-methyltransferase